jgi:hypothetical protein
MSYLEKARAKLKQAEPTPEYRVVERPIADVTEGRVIAYLIASEVLGFDIWLALDDDFDPRDRLAVFYAHEIPLLAEKTPQQLREVHKIKLAFGPGSRVRQ